MKSSQYSRAGKVAQFDGLQRHGDNLGSPNTSNTFEHPVGAEVSRWSPHASPTLGYHDPEEDHIPHNKSVLTKVKEKAKKLKHSLSGKKKHSEEGNITPAWGVSLEDAEYIGAPMYESEMAPEGYKVHTRQHPRIIPVISEKHVLPSSVKCDNRQESEKPPNSSLIVNETPAPNKISTETETSNNSLTETATKNKTITQTETATPNKTLTETATEKLDPAYATKTDATHAIASKIQNLNKTPNETVTLSKTPTETETATANKTLTETVTEKLAPAYATVSDATHAIASKTQNLAVSALASPETEKHTTLETSKQANPATVEQATPETGRQTTKETGKEGSPSGQKWEKGVSVKEYIMNKFEPGEDEKALSKVITDAMSPHRSPREVRVVEKVKEAVSSFLWNEETSQSSISSSATSSSPIIPVSTNAHEENHGRVLQTN